LSLAPRGEFSIVIAGLAVGAGLQPQLAPLATAYVLVTVIVGSITARLPDAGWFRRLVSGSTGQDGQFNQIPTSEPSA
jgi:CPA2 family monovalent cation:H+ antiporter-2